MCIRDSVGRWYLAEIEKYEVVFLSLLALERRLAEQPCLILHCAYTCLLYTSSVHGVCGALGTLFTGIFGEGCSFITQMIGFVAVAAYLSLIHIS